MAVTERQNAVKPSQQTPTTPASTSTATKRPYLPFSVFFLSHFLSSGLFLWCLAWAIMGVLFDAHRIMYSITANSYAFYATFAFFIAPLVYYAVTIDRKRYSLHETSGIIAPVARILGCILALAIFKIFFFEEISTPHISTTIDELHRGI